LPDNNYVATTEWRHVEWTGRHYDARYKKLGTMNNVSFVPLPGDSLFINPFHSKKNI
jgi:hypothetical protein